MIELMLSIAYQQLCRFTYEVELTRQSDLIARAAPSYLQQDAMSRRRRGNEWRREGGGRERETEWGREKESSGGKGNEEVRMGYGMHANKGKDTT